MANQLYRTDVSINLGSRTSNLTFYWIALNLTGDNSYVVARDITNGFFTGGGWLFTLTGCIGEQCRFSRFKTVRCDENGHAAYYDNVPLGAVTGRLVGQIQVAYISAWLKWHSANDRRGKYGVRLGPLPHGITHENEWPTIFTLNVALFVTQHCTPRTTSNGVDYRSAFRTKEGFAYAITHAQLGFPGSRQKTRRQRV